jgi:hypothetical protein
MSNLNHLPKTGAKKRQAKKNKKKQNEIDKEEPVVEQVWAPLLSPRAQAFFAKKPVTQDFTPNIVTPNNSLPKASGPELKATEKKQQLEDLKLKLKNKRTQFKQTRAAKGTNGNGGNINSPGYLQEEIAKLQQGTSTEEEKKKLAELLEKRWSLCAGSGISMQQMKNTLAPKNSESLAHENS